MHTHTHIYTCICTCTHTRSGATPFRGRERQYRRDARCVTGAGSAPLSEVMISCAPQGRRWSPRRSCAAPEVCCYLGIDYRVPSAHDSRGAAAFFMEAGDLGPRGLFSWPSHRRAPTGGAPTGLFLCDVKTDSVTVCMGAD